MLDPITGELLSEDKNLFDLQLSSLFPVFGAWASTNGAGFNYLILMPNNTFVYAENDLAAVAPENGLEVGTYTYNAGTGAITFNIDYDDNDPGNGSGVGDIGISVTTGSTLSNGSNTLSILGGALVLTKILP
jgi:hypothetical protein